MKLKWQLPLLGATLISGLFLFSSKLTATPTGEGTEENPYLISTEEEFNQFRIAVNGGNSFEGVYFKLANDLDFKDFDDDGNTSNGNFTPIGTSRTPFKGYLDGDQHTISNITIKGSGLFAYKSEGWIKQLVLENLMVQSTNPSSNSNYRIGGLIGQATNTTIEEVGILNSNIYGASTDYTGGMVAVASTTTIKNSYVQANLRGQATGGLIYSATNSTIENSYFSGKMNTNNSSSRYGLIHTNSSTSVTNSYWDTEQSGAASSNGGGTGIKQQQLVTQAIAPNLDGFKGNPVWKILDPQADAMSFPIFKWQTVSCDSTYPSGTGHESNPYLIPDMKTFNAFKTQIAKGTDYVGIHFKLTTDLDFKDFDDDSDASNGNFTPIGTSSTPFRGSFDGGQHTLSNITIKGSGFFAYKTEGWIKHLVLENLMVKSTNPSYNSNYPIGGLIGQATNTVIEEVGILNSNIYGVSTGYDYTGGMVAVASTTTIKNSYVQANLRGQATGGLIYSATNSTIENSYFSGKMNTNSSSSRYGLIHTNSSTSVTNGYWDTEQSGAASSNGGTGIKRQQLVTQAFAPDLEGFKDNPAWKILNPQTEGMTLPVFKWQTVSLDSTYPSGTGHESNPYLIPDIETFNAFKTQIANGTDYAGIHFKLTTDLDFSNKSFTPIGTSTTPFRGFFDGGQHTLSNITIEGNYSYLGLFAYKSDGWIKQLVLDNLIVQSTNPSYNSPYRIGGLIGKATNTIIEEVGILNSKIYGAYSNYDCSGGMVGEASTTTIKNSYVQADLKAREIGGLIYSATNSTIENSYFTGKMDSSYKVGGLIYTGSSNITTNSYWDTKKSGATTSNGGGTPLSTEQFEAYTQTKTLPGFDFRNIWTNTPDSPYPIFKAKPLRPGSESSDMVVSGTIQPLILSIDVPTSETTFVLNPNGLADQQFVAPTFEFHNQSNSPLTVELKEFVQTTDVITDVLADHFPTWEGLNQAESKHLALALVPVEGNGWEQLLKSEHYVAENIAAMIGVLHPHQQVAFTFKAFHGTAFNEALLPSYRLTFVFGLKD